MTKRKLIETIEIPQYIQEVCISKRRRPKYDEEGNITNKRTAGKPRMLQINGQSLWVSMNPYIRSKIADELKKYFYEQIRHIDPIENYPISIDMEFHLPYKNYDIDNLSVWYRKCFHDALAGSVGYVAQEIEETNSKGEIVTKKYYLPNHDDYPPKIPDDNVSYIQEANTKFIPVDTMNDRKLIIKIYRI